MQPLVNNERFGSASFALWDEPGQHRTGSLKVCNAGAGPGWLQSDTTLDATRYLAWMYHREGYTVHLEFVNDVSYPCLALHGTTCSPEQVFANYRLRTGTGPSRGKAGNVSNRITSRLLRFCLPCHARKDPLYSVAILGGCAGLDRQWLQTGSADRDNRKDYDEFYVSRLRELFVRGQFDGRITTRFIRDSEEAHLSGYGSNLFYNQLLQYQAVVNEGLHTEVWVTILGRSIGCCARLRKLDPASAGRLQDDVESQLASYLRYTRLVC